MAKHRAFPSIAVRFDKNAVMLFSRKDGTKMRFSVGPYTKASKPELVDIKISGYCSYGCKFCYQASTLQGKHADMEDVRFVVKELTKAKVAEVAIGGGETLEFPHIIETFKLFKDAGIVPNFTTKFPGLVRKHWKELEPLIGGFAYSAENAAQIRSAAKLFRNIPNRFVNLHYVMGLGDREHFREYLMAAAEVGYRVTLLGYKTTGFGKNVIPFPYDWWVDEVESLVKQDLSPTLSIDTPLAAQFEGKMPIEKHQYHTREGAYSMYIDISEMKFGASSFDGDDKLYPFTKDWRKLYRKKSFTQEG